MILSLDMEVACDEPVPDRADMARWLQAALPDGAGTLEVSLRVVSAQEMQNLNATWRHRDYPTNVLAFPCNLPVAQDTLLLGDIVLCAEVINREAREQGKSAEAHWAHMVVHGALHLQGHDHLHAGEAARMEVEETNVLASLGLPCPYVDTTWERRA